MRDLLERLFTQLDRLPPVPEAIDAAQDGADLARVTERIRLTHSLRFLRDLACNQEAVLPHWRRAVDALLTDTILLDPLEALWRDLQPLTTPDDIIDCLIRHQDTCLLVDEQVQGLGQRLLDEVPPEPQS